MHRQHRIIFLSCLRWSVHSGVQYFCLLVFEALLVFCFFTFFALPHLMPVTLVSDSLGDRMVLGPLDVWGDRAGRMGEGDMPGSPVGDGVGWGCSTPGNEVLVSAPTGWAIPIPSSGCDDGVTCLAAAAWEVLVSSGAWKDTVTDTVWGPVGNWSDDKEGLLAGRGLVGNATSPVVWSDAWPRPSLWRVTLFTPTPRRRAKVLHLPMFPSHLCSAFL